MSRLLAATATIRATACAGAAALAAALVAATASGGPVAQRCAPGSAAVVAGTEALLVRRAGSGDRAELLACRRGAGNAVRLGSTYGNGPNPRARSTLVAAAVGGTVVAAGFEVVAHGCIYERGCADAPRQVLRIADTSAGTLRRIPLHGSLIVVAVASDGRSTFRVDEFACTSTYRATAVPGSTVVLVGRVATRVPGGAGLLLCGR
jgi:hypothetical protein